MGTMYAKGIQKKDSVDSERKHKPTRKKSNRKQESEKVFIPDVLTVPTC